jgi:hypothetical protein
MWSMTLEVAADAAVEKGATMGIFRDLKDLNSASDALPMVGTARVISVGSRTDGADGGLTARVELQIDGSETDSWVVVTSTNVPGDRAHQVVPGAALAMSIHGSDPTSWVIDWGD